jgi:hypothetical protein
MHLLRVQYINLRESDVFSRSRELRDRRFKSRDPCHRRFTVDQIGVEAAWIVAPVRLYPRFTRQAGRAELATKPQYQRAPRMSDYSDKVDLMQA